MKFGGKQFLGSRMEGEKESEQIEREAEWKEKHSCSFCGRFECNGSCLEGEK